MSASSDQQRLAEQARRRERRQRGKRAGPAQSRKARGGKVRRSTIIELTAAEQELALRWSEQR